MRIDPLKIIEGLKLDAKDKSRFLALTSKLDERYAHLKNLPEVGKKLELLKEGLPEIRSKTERLLILTKEVLSHETGWHWFDLGHVDRVLGIMPEEELIKSDPKETLPFPFVFLTCYYDQTCVGLFVIRETDTQIRSILALSKDASKENINDNWLVFRNPLSLQNDGIVWNTLHNESDSTLERDIILSFLKILRCKNVSVIKEKVPQKIFLSRQREGKFGGYSRHILTINNEEKRTTRDGDNLSDRHVRLHFRRGHIRRLPKGNIWVTECMVGKAKGFVDKSYRVEA